MIKLLRSMLVVFFCELYGDHRDLHVLTHSFPPRRSSDLSRFARAWQASRQIGHPHAAAAAHIRFPAHAARACRRPATSCRPACRWTAKHAPAAAFAHLARPLLDRARIHLREGPPTPNDTLFRSEKRLEGQEGVSAYGTRWSTAP